MHSITWHASKLFSQDTEHDILSKKTAPLPFFSAADIVQVAPSHLNTRQPLRGGIDLGQLIIFIAFNIFEVSRILDQVDKKERSYDWTAEKIVILNWKNSKLE